jgi:hypothetical protein
VPGELGAFVLTGGVVTGGTVQAPSLGAPITFTLSNTPANTTVTLTGRDAKEFGLGKNTTLDAVLTDAVPPILNLVGKFVVLKLHTQVTGALPSDPLVVDAIHVTGAHSPPLDRPAGGKALGSADADKPGKGQGGRPESSGTANFKGPFRGVDAEGHWLIGGKKVTVGPNTEVETALVAGQVAEVEAEIQPDGSLLATSIEGKDRPDHPKTTRLNGVFQGVDAAGNWIISGTPVAVGQDSDTDGLPAEGQRVKVKALLQADGSLRAREIENTFGRRESKEDRDEARLSGTFQGVDSDGNWVIHGKSVSVDARTRLKGAVAKGHRVEVKATPKEDGTLRALKIEGDDEDAGSSRGKSEAEVHGVVQTVQAGRVLTINGLAIGLNAQTQVEGDVKVGDLVKVAARIRDDGTLEATGVEVEDGAQRGSTPEEREARLSGVIEKVNQDRTLVVNGITIVLGPGAEVRGRLIAGARIEVRGNFRKDGSIVAAQVRAAAADASEERRPEGKGKP